MSGILEHKCPACGGTMVYLPEEGLLKCEYCDTKMSVDEYTSVLEEEQPEAMAESHTAPKDETQNASAVSVGEQPSEEEAPEEKKKEKKNELTGFDFSTFTDQVMKEDAENLPVYNCVSCAAEVIAPPEQVALTCPYCGNNIVLTDKVSGKLRPDAIIPFKIKSDQVSQAVSRYYKGKKLIPRGFFSSAKIGKVTGVYLPFWLFDGKVYGTVGYKGDKVSYYSDGDYDVTETKHYRLRRDVSMAFASIPIDASKKADDAIMDSIGPFDLSQAKPFDMAYMAGFTADRFDEKKGTITTRVTNRIIKSAGQIAETQATTGYVHVSQDGGKLKTDLSAKYILFPLYLFELEHEGKKYPFAMNGQTGKVSGHLPIDKSVSRQYFWTRTGAVAGGLLLFSVLKYLLGF